MVGGAAILKIHKQMALGGFLEKLRISSITAIRNGATLMLTEEQRKAIAKTSAEIRELSEKLRDTPIEEMVAARALMARIEELDTAQQRAMGLSKTEILEINRRSDSETEAKIQSEVKIGLALFERALRGDEAAIARLEKGSLEFAVAMGEGAISKADLEKLPLAATFAVAAHNATKH
jgi:hypothetical protein